jgi:RHS repeat-associated protein
LGNLASATWGVVSIAYASNGDGLRVRATSGSTTSTYTWDEAAALPSLLSDGTSGYLSADATLLAETSASTNAYPLTDALGSVRAQTDGTATVTASASYDVFGSVRSSTGSIGALAYTGALSDSSGLTYLQARELDPATGTFASRDSLTPGGSGVTGFNPYAYAGQNPTTYTDPSGRGLAQTAAAHLPAGLSIPALGAFGKTVVVLVTIDAILLGCIVTRACAFPNPWAPDTDAPARPKPPGDVIPFPKQPPPGPGSQPEPHLIPLPQPQPEPDDRNPRAGVTVYRVASDPGSLGQYWTPQDPRAWGPLGYRSAAGLPDRLNAGTWLLTGVLNEPEGVVARVASPIGPPYSYCTYDRPSVTEYFVPNPALQVSVTSALPLNPPYGGRPSVCPDGSIPPA